jgi:hypothetical protein
MNSNMLSSRSRKRVAFMPYLWSCKLVVLAHLPIALDNHLRNKHSRTHRALPCDQSPLWAGNSNLPVSASRSQAQQYSPSSQLALIVGLPAQHLRSTRTDSSSSCRSRWRLRCCWVCWCCSGGAPVPVIWNFRQPHLHIETALGPITCCI